MSLQHLQHRATASDNTTYIFPTGSLGAAADDRHIIVATVTRQTNDIPVSGIFVNGNSPEYILNGHGPGGQEIMSAIAIFHVPEAITTGNINVTWISTVARCVIDVWRIDNLASAQPFYTGYDITPSGPTLIASKPIGATIAIAGTATNSASGTWVGLTEQTDSTIESLGYSTAYEESIVSGTGIVAWNLTNPGTDSGMSIVSWEYNSEPSPYTKKVLIFG